MAMSQIWTIAFGTIAAGLYLQAMYYFHRLPSRVAILYELDGTPTFFAPKLLFFSMWLILVTISVAVFWSARFKIPLWHAGGVLLFLLGACQLMVRANLGNGRLSNAIWLWIGLFIAFIGASLSLRGKL